MSHPFRPLSTEKLKNYLKKIVEGNCGSQDANQRLKKPSGKKAGNKLIRSDRIPNTWGQKERNL
jgi:hypothetical protein